jgi:hypothetical protein
VRGFDANVDIKYIPPQDARLRDFDTDAFDEETGSRYALSVSTSPIVRRLSSHSSRPAEIR